MISVCLGSYNGLKFIEKQIASITSQMGENDELIVSDDSSTDGTASFLRNLNDKRLKVLKNSNKGVISNFENALNHVNGDYIFLADQDDIWKPGKIEACIKAFKQGYNLVLSDCEVFDSNTGRIIHPSFFNFNKSRQGLANNLIHNSYIGCCMAFDRKVLDLALPFPKGIPMHDSWIGLLAEAKYKVKFLDDSLIEYRVHDNNASDTGSGNSRYSLVRKLSFRLNLIFPLLRRLVR